MQMAMWTIIKYPDPILNKLSQPVRIFDSNLRRFVQGMFDTMYRMRGAGLSAVQIGELKRIIVVDCGEPLALINPEIVHREGEQVSRESCLSFDETKVVEVIRPQKIKVEYKDWLGLSHIVEADNDLLSRCLAHELDHLDGRTFLDVV
jgi:peptide deformylase